VVVKQRFHLLIQNNKATNKYYRYPLFLLLIIITAIITAVIIAVIIAVITAIIIIITVLIIGGRRNRCGRGLLNRRNGRFNRCGRGLLNNTRVIIADIIALIIGGRHRFGVLVRAFCCGNRRGNGTRLLNRWR
jgi:hypothetical protein